MKYFLGLDNGGTATKAALFDETGKEISSASMDTAMIVPKPGFTERDMNEMWEANCSVIKKAIERSKVNKEDILCVTVCGHGKGLYLWGKDEKPVRNGIISTDNRAWDYPVRWEKEGIVEKAFKLSCQHVLSSQPVSLLAWLKDHEPESIKRTKWIFSCKDYVRFMLTGKAFGERTDYSGANFMNLHTGEYDENLLALFGIKECKNMLPPLCNATDICGYVTKEAAISCGLYEGTPVAGGAFDIDACAIGVNVVDENHICMIAGTWSINEYISRQPIEDGSVMMNSYFCLPDYYLIEECSPTSAGNNEWFMKNLLPELREECRKRKTNIYEIMNEWVESIPAKEICPIYLPFLMASNVHPNALGSFVGISNYHTRKHLLRSVYEGVTFSHRYHLEKLMRTNRNQVESIRLAGGAARSRMWTQMFADIMNLPVESVSVNETGALGCAIIGAVATGLYKNLKEAADKMSLVGELIKPDPQNVLIYNKKYQLYKKTIDALDAVWDDFQIIKEV